MFGKVKTWRDIAIIRTYIKNIYIRYDEDT